MSPESRVGTVPSRNESGAFLNMDTCATEFNLLAPEFYI